jgi:hypothetical protein
MNPKKKAKSRLLKGGDGDKPISDAYAAIDTDLARDNVENHIPAADLQDL